MKIATVVGARPQFVKAAVISRAFKVLPEAKEVVIHTGQHYDSNMSEIFFEELEIPRPAYNLAVGSASHGAQTGRMLEAVERVLVSERPQFMLVYGDTNSTLAGALAAVKMNIPVAHVEAGLRSFDSRIPEEINRVLTDHISTLLFAPTKWAAENLRKEGIAGHHVHVPGDVMCDAAQYYGAKAEARSGNILKQLDLSSKHYVLTTLHRVENTEQPERLRKIFQAFAEVSSRMPLVFPMHPRTRKTLAEIGLLEQVVRSVRVVPPAGYIDMVALEKHARLIATDSGGVQKEAFLHGVPCVTLRERTEWTELVDFGWNVVANPNDVEGMVKAIRRYLDGMPAKVENPYGDGHAGERIAATILASEGARLTFKCATG